MTRGQVVFSKRGRDKGMPMIIVATDGEYAYLADGVRRPIDRPKKKKAKHIQLTNTFMELEIQRGLQDADVRKLLAEFT